MAGAMVFVMIVDIFPASQNDAQGSSTPVVCVRSLHHNTLGFSADWYVSEQNPDAVLMTRLPLQESSAIKAVKVGFHHLNQLCFHGRSLMLLLSSTVAVNQQRMLLRVGNNVRLCLSFSFFMTMLSGVVSIIGIPYPQSFLGL